MQTIYRQPNERLLKSPISYNQDIDEDSEDRTLAVPIRVRITPLGDVVWDDTRDRLLSLKAESIVRELKKETEDAQARVLVDRKLGTITRVL